MAFLQSFADDSIGHVGDERLFMGGYLGSYETWGKFSDDWKSILNEHPRIEYLKMVEAKGLRGQFRGWSKEQRNKKLVRFCEVIQNHNISSFDFSLSSKCYRELVKPYAPRVVATPYFAANFHVVSGLARYLEDQVDLKVQFVFDTQKGVDADVHLFFEQMCRNLNDSAKDKISGLPKFLDDRDVPPLQAADMMAWFVRRMHQLGEDSLPIPMELVRSEYHISSEIPDSSLRYWGEQFASTPGVQLLKSKGQWQKFRSELSKLINAGLVPPNFDDGENSIDHYREHVCKFINEND